MELKTAVSEELREVAWLATVVLSLSTLSVGLAVGLSLALLGGLPYLRHNLNRASRSRNARSRNDRPTARRRFRHRSDASQATRPARFPLVLPARRSRSGPAAPPGRGSFPWHRQDDLPTGARYSGAVGRLTVLAVLCGKVARVPGAPHGAQAQLERLPQASLVSCPVALFPATTTSERVSFRTLNRETGNRVRRQFVDEQTGEPVETEDQVKGYEVGKGEFIQIEDDELKSVQIESNHTIDIERFVPRTEIDELTRHALLPDTHRPRGRGGVRSHPRRHALGEDGGPGPRRPLPPRAAYDAGASRQGIAAMTLRFANEVHASSNYFDEIPDAAIPKEMLELAKHIIEKMTGKFRPEEFQDRYENAVIELIRSKQKGLPVKPQPTHRQANVINLMDALRRSVEGAKGDADEKSAASPRSAAKKPAADRRAKGKARIKKAG